jgi:hypothetical protein
LECNNKACGSQQGRLETNTSKIFPNLNIVLLVVLQETMEDNILFEKFVVVFFLT